MRTLLPDLARATHPAESERAATALARRGHGLSQPVRTLAGRGARPDPHARRARALGRGRYGTRKVLKPFAVEFSCLVFASVMLPGPVMISGEVVKKPKNPSLVPL